MDERRLPQAQAVTAAVTAIVAPLEAALQVEAVPVAEDENTAVGTTNDNSALLWPWRGRQARCRKFQPDPRTRAGGRRRRVQTVLWPKRLGEGQRQL